ncbi:MAG: hypothetical protein JOY80_06530 [Candidatus Dormibacteraeota bacterium]|nr:hypothetical protein [Candidatus Dormibacteraeota bacterium]
MSDEANDSEKNDHKPGLRERIHEHLEAAEVAAEEAAGYGWATEAVEATEAAVDPKHELGDRKDDKGDKPAETAPSDESPADGEES